MLYIEPVLFLENPDHLEVMEIVFIWLVFLITLEFFSVYYFSIFFSFIIDNYIYNNIIISIFRFCILAIIMVKYTA